MPLILDNQMDSILDAWYEWIMEIYICYQQKGKFWSINHEKIKKKQSQHSISKMKYHFSMHKYKGAIIQVTLLTYFT